MVNKFLETANKIGDEIHARVPTDHQGSAFHCPGFIKQLSHAKHSIYYKIKNFVLDDDLTNLDEFCKLLKDYRKFSNKSKKIEDIYQKM